MADKTNAARILDRLNIKYSLKEYEFDPDNLEAGHVAETIGEPVEKVYKTLVLRGDKNGIFVCVIAGNREVDLKKAAKVSGNKKVEMIPVKELLTVTGYIRGGCTALGMKKNYPIYISREIKDLPDIFVSAGKRGLQIHLLVEDYLKATKGVLSDLVNSNKEIK